MRFPNLGTPGAVVAALVTSFFAEQIVTGVAIVLLYGRTAYFSEGLRVIATKPTWTLSNGTPLPPLGVSIILFGMLPLWVTLILGVEFAAGRVRAFLAPGPRWAAMAARLIGAAALLGFSLRLYSSPRGFPFMHPIPLSALIGGAVLIWKAVASIFRSPSL